MSQKNYNLYKQAENNDVQDQEVGNQINYDINDLEYTLYCDEQLSSLAESSSEINDDPAIIDSSINYYDNEDEKNYNDILLNIWQSQNSDLPTKQQEEQQKDLQSLASDDAESKLASSEKVVVTATSFDKDGIFVPLAGGDNSPASLENV